MRSIAIVIAVLTALTAQESAAVEFYPILQPTTSYVNDTILMSIDSLSDGATLNSLTQGPQTIGFSSTMTKYSVPNSWETWGSPPFTESSTPNVLVHDNQSLLTLTLSTAARTFGFELEGANQVASNFKVRFLDGTLEVGSVELAVNGNAGARLFAAYTPTNTFTSVEITNPSQDSFGWAIANIRYSTTPVPEPSTYVLCAIATVVTGAIARRRAKAAI